ncbi:hypothetical protein H1S01_18070 [Heliobacterium chlorum]|uniref:Core-binding (CB) domain-containing protein n=1 Tax=Heliobacterium chlorum TaxID=2698 RepID=A0ABR7T8A7_HELCL|nr:hypothetical protein [Heliobacterium chlorum]MBC9786367.1 hypothetical protein [Heliobacterium chlorum]
MQHTNRFLDWLHNEGKDSKTIQAYQTILTQFSRWFTDTTGHNNIELVPHQATLTFF